MAMSGGKQDQYAATFGGVNFMEFKKDDTVIVNPLRIKSKILNELAYNLVLFYTNTSRESAKIIDQQRLNVQKKETDSIAAMHELKKYSTDMKELLLRGDLHRFGELLDKSWQSKKRMANNISNPHIDLLYNTALEAGATGGKISGAGGGGFMFFWCPGNSKSNVIQALKALDAAQKRYEFVVDGLKSWSATTQF
jgi:D-glycero-alpha-D-manno-heptose-7-phosphate kinase